ncbi:MAG: retropepsin-like aspartic protease [Candidatus Tantalella remota]|nr:retropepsin-like aspartic protease [Candidatus Tantalella remota]
MRRIIVATLILMMFSACGEWSASEGTDAGDKAITVSDDVVIILLKNQGKVKGIIKEKIEGGIVVDMGFGTVVVSKKDISAISYPEGREKGRMRTEWKEHVRSTQISDRQRKKELQDHEKRIEESRRILEQAAKNNIVNEDKEHKIRFSDPSRMMVDVVLNGKVKTRLLVDTGAHMVLVPIVMARRLGYRFLRDTKKVSTRLADGTVRAGYPITLKSVEVAGAKAKNVKAVAMDLSGQQGLLGMSFLKRFHVKMDPKKKSLVLKNK